MWHQKATTEKPIVAISRLKKPFVGFEQLILSFDDLKEVIENDTDYELWHAAMSSVNAVYLIVDTRTGTDMSDQLTDFLGVGPSMYPTEITRAI